MLNLLSLKLITLWLITVSAATQVWQFINTGLGRYALLVATLTALLLSQKRQTAIPLIVGLFLVLAILNRWVTAGSISLLALTILTLLAVVMLGLTTTLLARPQSPLSTSQFFRWLLLGYFVSQTNSLVIYYPVGFFDQTLITLVVFYAFWMGLGIIESDGTVRSVVAHLVFVGLAVIVVLGSILWVNFPYLRIF